jgi:aerotaxis receptor
MQYNKSEFLIETKVPSDELIISRTDLDGNITYANETFAQISGYTPDELIGKPHNIVRHPDMPKAAFKDLWEVIKSGRKWRGFVKNMRKDSGYYWVYAQISGVYKDDKLVEFKSIRTPISFEDKVKYQKLYDQMREDANENIRVVTYS